MVVLFTITICNCLFLIVLDLCKHHGLVVSLSEKWGHECEPCAIPSLSLLLLLLLLLFRFNLDYASWFNVMITITFTAFVEAEQCANKNKSYPGLVRRD